MRVTNWRDELQKVIDAAHGRRFRWGSHDCCQFAAKCVAAVSGYDARLVLPRYRNREEAEQVLAKVGGMRELVTIALGAPVHPSRAGAGDIVLVQFVNGVQPALCMGRESYAPGRRNLVPIQTLSALEAWVI
jgi:hypothetical protein